MIRKLSFVLLAVGAIALIDARPAAAGPVSRNNPYRSFSITGVNYGSMRWEQTHRGNTNSSRQGGYRGGSLFRGR